MTKRGMIELKLVRCWECRNHNSDKQCKLGYETSPTSFKCRDYNPRNYRYCSKCGEEINHNTSTDNWICKDERCSHIECKEVK